MRPALLLSFVVLQAIGCSAALAHEPGLPLPIQDRLASGRRAFGPVEFSAAMDINVRGQVAGFVWNVEAEIVQAVLWDRRSHTVEYLGDSGVSAFAVDINDRGDVVGSSDPGEAEAPHAILWHQGKTNDLGPIVDNGVVSGWPAINNRGQVIVTYPTSQSNDERDALAFVWEDGIRTELGTLGGDFTAASAINEHGDIAGVSETEDGELHFFLWSRGRMTDLGPGAVTSSSVALNDRGQVVFTVLDGSRPRQPILWDRGVRKALPTFGGDHHDVSAINDRGQAVGASQLATGEFHAVLWQDGVPRDLVLNSSLDPAFHQDTYAKEINDAGLVAVGAIGAPNNEQRYWSFVWQAGEWIDLGGLGGVSIDVRGINRRGQVVGFADNGVSVHAFVWEDGQMTDLHPSTGAIAASHSRVTMKSGHEPFAATSLAGVAGLDLSFGNSSRGSVRLALHVASGEPWDLALFDVTGRRVQDLGAGTGSSSTSTVVWDGTNRAGSSVRPGVYWARLSAGPRTITKRLLWLGDGRP